MHSNTDIWFQHNLDSLIECFRRVNPSHVFVATTRITQPASLTKAFDTYENLCKTFLKHSLVSIHNGDLVAKNYFAGFVNFSQDQGAPHCVDSVIQTVTTRHAPNIEALTETVRDTHGLYNKPNLFAQKTELIRAQPGLWKEISDTHYPYAVQLVITEMGDYEYTDKAMIKISNALQKNGIRHKILYGRSEGHLSATCSIATSHVFPVICFDNPDGQNVKQTHAALQSIVRKNYSTFSSPYSAAMPLIGFNHDAIGAYLDRINTVLNPSLSIAG